MKRYKILAMGVILAFLFGNTAVMAVPAIKKPAGGAASKVKVVDSTITGITVTPANPEINKAIEVTVQGTITPGMRCSIIFLKGDGTPQSVAGHATSFPFKFGGVAYPLFVYSKAGTYTIKVYCGDGKCTGEAQAVVKVGLKMQSFPHDGAVPNKKPAGGAASPAKAAASSLIQTASKIEVKSLTAPVGKDITLEARLITSKGELLGGKMIEFKVNNKLVGSFPTAATGTANAGTAKAPFHVSGDYPPGVYKIEARFAGDATAGMRHGQGNLTVVKAKTKIELTPLSQPVSQAGSLVVKGFLKNAVTSAPIGDRWINIKVGNTAKKVVTSHTEGSFKEVFQVPSAVTNEWNPNVPFTILAEFSGDAYFESAQATLNVIAEQQPPPKITSTDPKKYPAGVRLLFDVIGTDLWPNGMDVGRIKRENAIQVSINMGSYNEECMLRRLSGNIHKVECLCRTVKPSFKVKVVVLGRSSNIYEVPIVDKAITINSINPARTLFGSPANSPDYNLRLYVTGIPEIEFIRFGAFVLKPDQFTPHESEGYVSFSVPDKLKTVAGSVNVTAYNGWVYSNAVNWEHYKGLTVNPATMKATPKKLK